MKINETFTIERMPSPGDYLEAQKLYESGLEQMAIYVMEVRVIENRLFAFQHSLSSLSREKVQSDFSEQTMRNTISRLRDENKALIEKYNNVQIELQKIRELEKHETAEEAYNHYIKVSTKLHNNSIIRAKRNESAGI